MEYILQHDIFDADKGTKFTRLKGDLSEYYEYKTIHDRYSRTHFQFVENNEKWFLPEQPKPKEWEILKWYRQRDNSISTIGSLYEGDKTEIHSVKRLSDSQIFTIGDNTTRGIIKAFNYIKDMDMLEVEVGDQKTLLRTFDKLPPKEEPLPIKVQFSNKVEKESLEWRYLVYTDKIIPPEKYEPIKKAITGILNDKVEWHWYEKGISFTKEELMKAARDAFYAARETVGYWNGMSTSPLEEKNKYPTFSDYYETLNK